ncbi:alkyl/aryl-sulfatase [Vibrio vulnificus]|uniref:alkyl/aryl-sulfatase n=1 Tax=Vibrio vulnificus TaxID=672 RepID=UPI0024DF5733|nr:alkyl sulfatase dimerization domain-containing protein [Vibrio vulnificus]MDK2614597.1 alkyl sulfatase dimerization domain-containing protein [Vibrio vulnificus]MDK2672113.1 alkyl sulfatase dimerization domain-containing protein [Vibrio vulnificus]MDS1838510.1 alkyl sulfatase dimerization domain-containing protein [Vibrio vulnificus]MDS1846719.1 alkyl sulfatase dimerization domain-containing protein [Vibrio vulnificus]
MNIRFVPSTLTLALMVSFSASADYASLENYQGKPATTHTKQANAELAKQLPWHDTSAFERTGRGLIAEFGSHQAGELKQRFDYMAEMNVAQLPDTVNPSIWRQGMLNYTAGGLYEVTDGVYQIRGADLSNMTIYRTNNGYVIHDPLLSREAAAASWEFAKQHLPKVKGGHKITGMIYSHMHADHFGGSRGILDSGDMVKNAPIYAPKDFIKELADENIIAGTAMGRRANYQYGTTLDNNTQGIVDNALGLGTSRGEVTLVTPTVEIDPREKEITIDGLTFLAINMPGAEAPAEIVLYVPKYRSLNTAELTYDGMHNIYTFRGAKVRDSLVWTKYLTELKLRFVDSGLVDNIHAAHSAPVWNDPSTEVNEISQYMTLQRDNYGFIHNQSMRLANHGVTIHDVGREIEKIVPQTQKETWHTNGYHGSYSHNARAVVNLYLGYHDMNPVNTNPLETQDKSCVYVEAAGAERLFKAGQSHFSKGEYQQASQLFNDLVQCEPNNIQYRFALADSFEQQGYQSETMAWRNSYLQGAVELRTGKIKPSIKLASADVIANTPTGMFLDFVAVKLNATKAEQAGLDFRFGVSHPELKEHYYGEVSNANMANIQVDKLPKTDVTLSISKSDLTQMVLGKTTLDKLVKEGKVNLKGDAQLIKALSECLDEFDGLFEILPMPNKKA